MIKIVCSCVLASGLTCPPNKWLGKQFFVFCGIIEKDKNNLIITIMKLINGILNYFFEKKRYFILEKCETCNKDTIHEVRLLVSGKNFDKTEVSYKCVECSDNYIDTEKFVFIDKDKFEEIKSRDLLRDT